MAWPVKKNSSGERYVGALAWGRRKKNSLLFIVWAARNS
jgi:hypothetical protein